MTNPKVSVILPVYNSGAYLSLAIDSMLGQTFKDFELIIINDGSTDNSEEIIQSYRDDRIIYLANERNEGLVYTLNRGIDQARGAFIARMDGDDISLPERLEKQLLYFSRHPETRLIASTVILIDEEGKETGYWKEDRQAIDAKQIRRQLPKDNCIAHPTIFCRTALLKQYRYNPLQSQAEDYDLWLRLQAANIPICKISEPLVLHRIVKNSFTRKRQQNVFKKNAQTKRRFVYGQWKKKQFSTFELTVFIYSLSDAVKGLLKPLKAFLTEK